MLGKGARMLSKAEEGVGHLWPELASTSETEGGGGKIAERFTREEKVASVATSLYRRRLVATATLRHMSRKIT